MLAMLCQPPSPLALGGLAAVSVQDPMISQHESVESGPPSHRCQVVRWVRSFPFSFIKEREYYIARRAWRQQVRSGSPCPVLHLHL